MGHFTLKLSVTAMDAAVLTVSYDIAFCAGMDSTRGEYCVCVKGHDVQSGLPPQRARHSFLVGVERGVGRFCAAVWAACMVLH